MLSRFRSHFSGESIHGRRHQAPMFQVRSKGGRYHATLPQMPLSCRRYPPPLHLFMVRSNFWHKNYSLTGSFSFLCLRPKFDTLGNTSPERLQIADTIQHNHSP